jgi:hypothetical protein
LGEVVECCELDFSNGDELVKHRQIPFSVIPARVIVVENA